MVVTVTPMDGRHTPKDADCDRISTEFCTLSLTGASKSHIPREHGEEGAARTEQ